MSSGSDAYSLKIVRLTSTRPFRLQRTFQRLSASCNRITWVVVLFRTSLPKNRDVWAFLGLIVSPLVVYFVIARVELFPTSVGENLVVSDVFEYEDEFRLIIQQLWRLSPQNQMLSLNDEFTSVWCCPCPYMPASLSISTISSPFCCHFNVWNLDFSLFFHRIDWWVSTNALGYFSVFCSWDSYSKISFSRIESRIALIITIRIATIHPFLAVSIAVPTDFNASTFTNLARIPVQPPLAAASPITASWQRIMKEGDYSYFDERHSVFQLVSSCFSIFDIPYSLML